SIMWKMLPSKSIVWPACRSVNATNTLSAGCTFNTCCFICPYTSGYFVGTYITCAFQNSPAAKFAFHCFTHSFEQNVVHQLPPYKTLRNNVYQFFIILFLHAESQNCHQKIYKNESQVIS